ncbi:MAG: FecR family protein [Bacteroidetes bacterium]|nr:FecR family protein [Bacteroidota bacterium]
MENLENHIINYEELIHRFLFHEASADEIRILREWIRNDAENQKDFEQYRSIRQLVQRACRNNEYDEQTAWDKLKRSILFSDDVILPRRFYLQQLSKIAAIFVLAFFSGILTLYFINRPAKQYQEMTYSEHKVSYGSKSQLVLPDGSKVWLNAGSKLRYSLQFNQTIREVYLEGEGFFDVSKNKDKPFLVRTTGVTIKVLGTAFNVKAYPDEKTIETSVERGLVQVISNSPSVTGTQKIFLHANQKAIFEKFDHKKLNNSSTGTSPVMIMKNDTIGMIKPMAIADAVNVTAISSWKERRWIIERERLEDLAVKIERRYDVKILFGDDRLRSYIFSGVLEDESLEQILNIIRLSAPINYEINQKVVKLYGNKKFNTSK